MSARIGNIAFRSPQPGEMVTDKPYSEQTARIIDEEVMLIVKGAYNRTKQLLTERKAEVELVSVSWIFIDEQKIGARRIAAVL